MRSSYRNPSAALLALYTDACALLLLAGSWWWFITVQHGGTDAAALLVAVALGVAVVAAYHWPVHLRPNTKIYLASVPYYLLAAHLPAPLAATAASLAALAGELSVRQQRATPYGTIAAETGRRALIVWAGAAVAAFPTGSTWHILALAAAAVVMEASDILTCPLILGPLNGQPPRRIIAEVGRDAALMEGAQYLLGLLGALALTDQVWVLALLAAPCALLYLAFQALHQAERAQRMSEDALRMRDDFLRAGSHDLRTPLTVLLGRAEMLHRLLDADARLDPDRLRNQVIAMQRAAERMRDTVEEMNDLVQLRLGETPPLRLEPLDLGLLVEATVPVVVGATVPTLQVQLQQCVLVEGDRTRLGRALQNIIGNAVKYSTPDTPIQIEVTAASGWAKVAVRDHGVGIPASDLERIFEPFYRAATAAGIAGSGIGLTNANAIIAQHGGRIVVDSVVGQGTTMLVLLPELSTSRAAP